MRRSCVLITAVLSLASTAAPAQICPSRYPAYGRWTWRTSSDNFIPGRHSYINRIGEWIPSLDDPWHLPGSQ